MEIPDDLHNSYTNRQRRWFHRVYNGQCAFYEFSEKAGRWRRCPSRTRVQIHHLIPVRWSKRWFPSFNYDSCLNGVALCLKHHCEIHPDLKFAYDEYRTGNKLAFKMMMKYRDEEVAKGIPYWDGTWDFLLRRIARKFIFRYIALHPDDLFPPRKKRRRR